MEIALTIVGIIGIAVILHKVFNSQAAENLGNSRKPSHQRVIKKTS